jgi:hypothetical protein
MELVTPVLTALSNSSLLLVAPPSPLHTQQVNSHSSLLPILTMAATAPKRKVAYYYDRE